MMPAENGAAPQLYALGTIAEERRFRLEVLDGNGLGVKDRFWATFRAAAYAAEQRDSIAAALEYACSINYNHRGRTSEAYLAHPLRVTELVMSYVSPLQPLDAIIALLHNVLEVSTVAPAELGSCFGPVVMNSIVDLTVNREKQWDAAYKRDYYAKLRQGYAGACAVKVMDKLDNIFLLCMNANEQIRTKYLDEIEKYVIPLATDFVPRAAGYMQELSAEARAFGHLSS